MFPVKLSGESILFLVLVSTKLAIYINMIHGVYENNAGTGGRVTFEITLEIRLTPQHDKRTAIFPLRRN